MGVGVCGRVLGKVKSAVSFRRDYCEERFK